MQFIIADLRNYEMFLGQGILGRLVFKGRILTSSHLSLQEKLKLMFHHIYTHLQAFPAYGTSFKSHAQILSYMWKKKGLVF